MRIDNKEKTIYVLTAFGMLSDTICEIHDSFESARDSILEYVDDANAHEEKVCENVWRTESAGDGEIEWEIWEKRIIV